MKRIDFRDLQKYLHEIPNQLHDNDLLKKIYSMDAHTAYALLGGYLAPLLSVEKKPIAMSTPHFLHLSPTPNQSSNTEKISKKVSDIITKWSQIDEAIKKMKKAMDGLKNSDLMKDGVLDIDFIEDFWSDKHWKIVIISDPKKEFKKVFDAQKDLVDKVKQIKALIESVKDKLPPSSKKLIDRMNEILKNITTDKQSYNFYYFKEDQVRFEIPADQVNITDNDDLDSMRKFIQDFSFFKDQYDLEGYYKKHTLDLIGNSLKALLELINQKKENEVTVKDLEDRLSKLEKDNKEVVDDLKKEITGLKDKETTSKNKISELEKRIRILEKKEQELIELKKKVTRLEKENNDKDTTINQLRERIKTLLKEISDLTATKGENQDTIDELRRKITELNREISELEGKKEENTNTIDELTREINQLKKDKAEQDITIDDLRTKLRETREELARITLEKDATIQELRDRIEAKDEEIENLKIEISDLKKKLTGKEALEQELIDLKLEKDRLEQSKDEAISGLKEKLAELNRRITQLEKLKNIEIEKLQKDLENVRNQLKIKEKEIKDGKIDEIGKELPDLQKLLKELEDGGIDLKDLGKLRDKLDNLNRLTKDGKDAVGDLEDLQKKINELREELKKQKLIELEKQKEKQEIIDRENKLDDLQLEILKLRRELKDLESLKGKDLTDLREKLEKLEKLKKEVGDSNDKVKELEDEVNNLRRELNKDKQDELDRLKEISDKEKEIERKKKEEEINKIKEIELEELKKKRGMMDAYVFMIVVFLTQLHTKQAEKLKAHGETLQKISRIFDQWNVIQRGLNTVSQNANVILRWIKERKVDSNYTLYTDSNLSTKETDPRKLAIWNTFKSFLPDLQKNVKELRRILDEVRPELPDSAKTLLDTMYKLSGKLLDIPDTKGTNELTSYLKVTTESEGEIKVSKEIEDLKTKNKELLKDANKLTNEMSAIRDDIGESRWHLTDWALKAFWPSYYKKKQNWNTKRRERDEIYTKIDANNKKIQEKESDLRNEIRQKIALPDKRLTILDWISDSDQTQFKAYMDNLAQGVTALTSISNMVQQELQIDTQYYNSLLGLQKAGMDSLTRTIQGIVANMR